MNIAPACARVGVIALVAWLGASLNAQGGEGGKAAISAIAISPHLTCKKPTTLTVTLDNPAPAGGANVKMQFVPRVVARDVQFSIQAGQRQGHSTFSAIMGPANVAASAYLDGVKATASLKFQVAPPSVQIAVPDRLTGGWILGGAVTLLDDCLAPPGGFPVAIVSDHPNIVPSANILVQGGSARIQFSVQTTPVTSDQRVTLSYGHKRSTVIITP